MTPKDPFSEGTFWDKFWRPIRSRALLFTPEKRPGEKGAPRNHPETSSQKLADFKCRFPYDSYGRVACGLTLCRDLNDRR